MSESLLDDAMWQPLPLMPHRRYWRGEALNIVEKEQDVSQGWPLNGGQPHVWQTLTCTTPGFRTYPSRGAGARGL